MEKDLETSLNSPFFWHQRYAQQIKWTETARRYLLKQTDVKAADHILEVGCGTGAVLNALSDDGYINLTGIDIDQEALFFIQEKNRIACADGLALPFPDNTFDHSLCHFTLMWIKKPVDMLSEMTRVTKENGWVFTLAESDYSSRVTFPAHLEKLAALQTDSLVMQGINPFMGMQLEGIFQICGLVNTIKGVIGYKNTVSCQNALSGDLEVLKTDLAHVLPEKEIEPLIKIAARLSKRNDIRWYVPIHYVCGQVMK